jgi:murein DD-endopeptidase MepM/ murein hydrolase activator NlpD
MSLFGAAGGLALAFVLGVTGGCGGGRSSRARLPDTVARDAGDDRGAATSVVGGAVSSTPATAGAVDATTATDASAVLDARGAPDADVDAYVAADAGDGAAPPSDAGPPPSHTCTSLPSPANVVIPFFQHIFAGVYRVANHFDHDVPKEFTDTNGVQIDWCGLHRTNEIDGHSGYDFKLPLNTPVLASADGVVDWAGTDSSFYCPLLDEVVTDQLRVELTQTLPDGRRITSNYLHLSRVDVAFLQEVHAGDVIGLSGNTGCSTGPHLHFETRMLDGTRTGGPVLFDPFGWEGAGPDPWAGMADGAPSIWLWKPDEAPIIFTAEPTVSATGSEVRP